MKCQLICRCQILWRCGCWRKRCRNGRSVISPLGQPEKALRELTTINDLCRMLEGRPTSKPMTLVAAMINVAVRGIYVGVVADGMYLQAWREPQLAVLQEQLKGVDMLPYVAGGFETERVASSYTLEHTTPEEYDKMFGASFSGTSTFQDKLKDPMFVFMTFAPRGWVYQNMVTIGKMDSKVIDEIDLKNHLVQAQTVGCFLSRNRSCNDQNLTANFPGCEMGSELHAGRANGGAQSNAGRPTRRSIVWRPGKVSPRPWQLSRKHWQR